jgi:hypothetical protein
VELRRATDGSHFAAGSASIVEEEDHSHTKPEATPQKHAQKPQQPSQLRNEAKDSDALIKNPPNEDKGCCCTIM